MPRTLDCPADNRAFIERRSVMRADCAQSMNLAVQLHQQYRLFCDRQALELTLNKITRCSSRREVIWPAPVGVAVDHDSHVKDHDASETAAQHYQQVSGQSNSKRSPARVPVLAPADEKR